MKKVLIAMRIREIDSQLKGLEDERDELREALVKKMSPGEAIPFETDEGPFRAKLCETEEKVLKENESILHHVGLAVFMQAAKVGCGSLQAALKGAYSDDEKVAQVFEACVLLRSKKTVLKLLRGR